VFAGVKVMLLCLLVLRSSCMFADVKLVLSCLPVLR